MAVQTDGCVSVGVSHVSVPFLPIFPLLGFARPLTYKLDCHLYTHPFNQLRHGKASSIYTEE